MKQKERHINQVLGLNVDITPRDQVLSFLEKRLRSSQKTFIVTLNPEMVMAAQADRQLTELINGADLVIPDGLGIVWALRRQGIKSVKRLAGTDLMLELIKTGHKTLLVGAGPGIAQKAADTLRLDLVGKPTRSNLVGMSEPDIKSINRIKPDLLFVALGHGQQEKWIAKNLPRLQVKVAMGVGGALDQIAKPWLRAPIFLRALGLEWCWRLLMQPWRLKRQLALLKFLAKIHYV